MLVDSNNKHLNTQGFKYFDEGSCSCIYRNNDIILKIYKPDCKKYYYFSKKTFDKLKLLNLDSLVKLYNYYYNNTFLHPNSYTMEYVNNPHLSLLNQSKSYLLDIISILEKDINILSNNNVIMYDAHYSNIIFQENKAKIIDIDLFRNNNFIDYKKLLYHNKEQLLKYIVSTIKHELQEQKTYNYLFDYIFCYSELLFTNVVDYLNEILTEDSIKDSIFKKIK